MWDWWRGSDLGRAGDVIERSGVTKPELGNEGNYVKIYIDNVSMN